MRHAHHGTPRPVRALPGSEVQGPRHPALTGWSDADAIGRPLADVFTILNEQSRRPVENPVGRVLREGQITGLANDTVLVSKDGREIPIDDSTAPIKDVAGTVLGAVLVFRDISQRRQVERERAILLDHERAARAEAERLSTWLRQLQNVMDTTLSARSVDDLLPELLARVRAAMASDTATVLLLAEDGPYLTPASSDGLRARMRENIRIPLGDGVAGRIALSDHGMIIDDLSTVEVLSPFLRERVRSLVGAPLKVRDGLLGVLHVGAVQPRRFTEDDLGLLRLVADRVAVAIERTRLDEAERTARAEADRQRREAEAAEQRLRLALEAGRMGTWDWTIATGELRWSSSLEAIHGFAPGTFPGTFEALRSEIHAEDRDHVLRAIAAAVEERRNHRVEYRIVRRDGAVRWVEGRGQLFSDAAGQPERMVGVCTDVTERKQTEERVRLAVEAAPTAMVMVDQRGTIRLVNALAEPLFGYARSELLGQSIERLVPWRFRDGHSEYRGGFFSDPQPRAMGEGRELYALRKDGTEVPVEIGLSPFETADGLFVLAAVTDITTRKQAEHERAQLLVREQAARQEAEAANRTKDQFLAVLSHELRQPLNTMLGWLSVLRLQPVDPVQQERALDAIERNTRAQARMIDDLLDIARIEAGKVTLERRAVSLGPLIADTVESLQHEAKAKALTLGTQLDPVARLVSADVDRLRQVLMNLLANAVKYTPSGGRVDVRLTAADGVVRIVVSDTGIGIEPDLLPHVFERFRQADVRSAGTQGGLGLGLAIVREFVEMHGGTVEAQSDGRGRGATFIVTLPMIAG